MIRERILRIALVAFVLVATLAPAVAMAAAQSHTISVTAIKTDDYPDVELVLGLPAAVTGTGRDPVFVISENDQNTTVLSSQELKEEASPVNVVLVIDTSGSMKGAALASAQAAARSFAEAFGGEGRIAVISFSTRPKLVVPFTSSDEKVIAGVDGLEASGETALYDAMSLAAKIASESGKESGAVVLLSDGGDTMSRSTLDDAVSQLKKARVSVSTVALPSKEANPSALRTVASQTGGRAISVKAIDQLPALYTNIAEELQRNWSVVYRSNRPATKDLEISVKATAGNVNARTFQVVANPRFKAVDPTEGKTLNISPANVAQLAFATVLASIAMALLAAGVLLLILRPKTHLDQLRFYEQLQGTGYEAASVQRDDNSIASRMYDTVEYVAGTRGFTAELRQRLERAGLPIRPVEYISMHVGAVVVTGVLVQMLTGMYVVAMFAVVLASFAPIFWIDYRIGKRARAFNEQLPDLLSLIAGSLRAGWGMMQAIDLVVEQTGPPARDEFRRVQTEARLGLPIDTSLAQMAERLDSDDFRWAVSAIAIQREVGGNLAEVLDVVAATIRERGALRRQVSSLTAEGRLSALILIALPFFEAITLWVVNPLYIKLLLTTTVGFVMSFMAVLLMIIGSLWLRKAMSVEV